MINAIDLVQKGSRWRISNKENVMVEKDRWIPGNLGFKIKGVMRNLLVNLRVCEIIDSDLRKWNRDLIFSLFDEDDAKQITNIPLSFCRPANSLIWHFQANGEFSVRTVFYLCM